jgi:hypothetical protein
MNPSKPFASDVFVGQVDDAQPPLSLASDGVLRWVWQGKFGPILIEVVDQDVLVNGERVEPYAS